MCANEPVTPVLDLDVFNELHATLGNSTDRVRNVYAKFLESAVKRIEELRQQPAATGARTLHALKGSAGMVGASRLAALAARLHDTTITQGLLALPSIKEIEAELASFRAALHSQLDGAGYKDGPGSDAGAG